MRVPDAREVTLASLDYFARLATVLWVEVNSDDWREYATLEFLLLAHKAKMERGQITFIKCLEPEKMRNKIFTSRAAPLIRIVSFQSKFANDPLD